MGLASMGIVAFLASFGCAQGAEILSGARVVLAEDTMITDDLYVAAEYFELRGVVQGDLILFAREAHLLGTVTGDVLLAAGQAQIEGEVAGSLRVAAGDLMVTSRVARDAVIAGSRVLIHRPGSVGRDLILAANHGEVAAPISREVVAAASTLRLNGEVGGSVLAQAQTIDLGEQALIRGHFTYTSEELAQMSPSASVLGQTERREPSWAGRTYLERAALYLYGWLRSLIGLAAAGLLWIAVFPVFTRHTQAVLAARPWASLGTGLLSTLGLPLLSALLFTAGLLLGGWWLGLIGLGTLALGLGVGLIITSISLGHWVLARFGRSGSPSAWALLLGLATLLLVGIIPGLGGALLLLAALFGLGALALAGLSQRTGGPQPA